VCQYGDFVAEAGPEVKDGAQHVNEKAQAARNDYHATEREHNDLEAKVRSLQDKVDRLQDESQLAFQAMDGECYELDKGHYVYKLCPFHRMEQVQGGRGTNMGNWKGFGEQTYSSWGAKHDFSKMVFNDGERCWSGPARETTVSLICGPTSVLLNVDEPSMCVYSAVLQTPAICE
jgi:protein kinase C substrate 80K-H